MQQRKRICLTITLIILLLLACNGKDTIINPDKNTSLSLTGSHCDVISYDANTILDALPDSISWTVDIGTIDTNGLWSYAPSLADVDDSIVVTISATDMQNNNYIVSVFIDFTNEAPVFNTLHIPKNVRADVATEIQIWATDDCDVIYYSVVSGPATIDSSSGLLKINAPANIDQQTIEVEATDGNASSTFEFDILVQTGSLYQIEIPHIGNSNDPVFQGQNVEVPINLIGGNIIHGYDLLVGYDNAILSFQSAQAGIDLVDDGWEYFTYRYGINGDCVNDCPTGLIRLTAIAETNNGPNHPVLDGVNELTVMDFFVTNDRTYECQNIPIRFFWLDCGDNNLSTDGANELYVSDIVYDGDPVLFPPNGDEIQDFSYGFPTYFGTQDECLVPVLNKPVPIRDVSFNNGSVKISCEGEIDLRGDINLNNVANEIADAVLYSNYFIYGIGAFVVNLEGQIAASDVNKDGLSLTVADLVYLIRIIVGDALPTYQLTPVTANLTNSSGTLSIDKEMGAVLVVIEGNVQPELLATNMNMISNFDGTNTRVLVYSIEGNTFTGTILDAKGVVVSVEFGSDKGATVIANNL